MSKRALGKGIDALLLGGLDKAVGEHVLTASVTTIPIGKIAPGEGQPRKAFNEETLEELAQSIRERGVLQPILVEQHGDSYSIVAGERRYRASVAAGLSEIPAIVRAFTREEKLEIALIENVQREDLTPIEEAEAYRNLINALKLSQEELAKRIGKKRSTVANSVRLLNLPDDMQRSLGSGELTAGHARAILAVQNPADQRVLFERIVAKGLSVREAESLAESLNRGGRAANAGREPARKHRRDDLAEIEQKFIHALGTKVRMSGSIEQGKIEISYYSRADLDRIYETLVPDQE